MAQADEAARVMPPMEASATAAAGDAGVYQFTVSTTALVYVVPDDWKGAYVNVETSALIHMHFGTAAPAALVVANQASATTGSGTVTSPYTMTPNDQTGRQIPAGGTRDWLITDAISHFSVIGAAAGTEVTINKSGPGGK